MSSYFHNFIFGYYPYIALMIFIVVSIAKYEYAQYEWKTASSQMLDKRWFSLGSNLFHTGIILLGIGHFFGLLTPEKVYTLMISPEKKQMVAMVCGGIFGMIAFFGCTILLVRRLFCLRVRETSTKMDIIILLLIYFQLIIGLLSIIISYEFTDANSMKSLALWTQSIVYFNLNASDFIIHEHWLFKLHIFLGITFFLLFPFTRLLHILSIPVTYIFRTGYQIVRKRN
ncbi:MAG: respiratory nitrate reductase subunit gamma [Candidatus Azosocius agrarius]|nr:MAG: respiratory nitrate reductase subunit gamma [Gammaproteobacteria bacterium]